MSNERNIGKMQNKKTKLMRALTIALVLTFLSAAIKVSADSVSDLQDKQAAIKTKTQNAKEYLNDAKAEKSGIMNEVLQLDIQLDEATQKLDSTTAQLDETNKNLEEAQTDLAEAETLHNDQYEKLKERLVYMYKSNSASYIEIILQSQSFTDFINRMEYVDTIINYDNDLLLEYIETEKRIAARVEEIDSARVALETLQNEQASQKQELEDAVADKNQRIINLTSDEISFQQQLLDLEEADRNVKKLIKEAEEEAARQKANAARAAAQPQTRYTGGAFGWPVPGYYSRSSEYGGRTNPISGKYETHSGIDIPAPTGTNIVAAEAGTVILSGYNGGYGYTIIIDHGGGLTTLYGHNSSLVAGYGEYVSKGQTIAKCGTTGYSTGPHCHFEVRVNGSSTQPLNYLN